MPLNKKVYTLKSSTRATIREELVRLFLNENPGLGIGDLSSKYHYAVESFAGIDIVIKRPAALNKGFDFTVNTSEALFMKLRRYSNPSHNDILRSLSYCKNHYPESYSKVKQQLIGIYNCSSLSVTQNDIGHFLDSDNNLRPIQIIILATKWLFIEQDITYWNWSGRQMFYTKLLSEGLV
jgi:hypothetical protein